MDRDKMVHVAQTEYYARAEAIVNSEPVISTFAACEWDDLQDDGKVWVAEIVRQAIVATPAQPDISALVEAVTAFVDRWDVGDRTDTDYVAGLMKKALANTKAGEAACPDESWKRANQPWGVP
jgi:hypothetical protein